MASGKGLFWHSLGGPVYPGQGFSSHVQPFFKTSCLRFWVWTLAFLLLFAWQGPSVSRASEPAEPVAVLPFSIHAPEPLDHLRTDLQEMLGARLRDQGFPVVSPEVVNRDPRAFSETFSTRDLIEMGTQLNVRWVIWGSLTQIGEKASLDLRITDTSQRMPPFSLFAVADHLAELSGTVNQLSRTVNERISGIPLVDAIQVRGNRRIEDAAILAVIETRTGDRIDYDRLDRDLRSIFRMGFFRDVRMETQDSPSGKVIIFSVVEKPSIGRIVFEGNKKIDDEDLRKEIGISLYSILDNSEVRQSINRVKEAYRKKGYYKADIQETIEDLPNNEVLLKYKVDEGDKIYIQKIQFVGNTAFDDKRLKKLMETSEKWFLSWLTNAGLLDMKKLEFDTLKITSFYHNNGYIRAKTGEPRVVYDDDLKGLVVTIDIEEGSQYGVRDVVIQGDLIEPADVLLARTRIGQEKIFNREVLRQDILTLRDIYGDQGYAYAEVRPVVQEDDVEHVADIVFDISKGPVVRFERITISGNDHTRDKVIRRELAVMEGASFSGTGLQKSTANLHRLGFFEDIQMQTGKGSQEDLMNLDVIVKEQATRTFSVGAGYSSAYSGFVMFQVADENFLGYGQKLQAAARIGGMNTEFDIRFVEPWLFDKPYSLGVDLYSWRQEYTDYYRSSLGGAVSLGVPLPIDEYTRGIVRYDFDRANISDVTATSGPLYDMIGRNITSSLTLTVRRDSRDHLWNTTKGSVNEASFQYAGGLLSGDEEFNKYRARTAWYFSLPWSTVFLVQGRWGYVQDTGKVSVFQKFFLGGIDTVRGFPYNRISPIQDGYLVGGNKMMVYNAEYRFPLLKEQGVVGLVFFDAGNVFDFGESWTFSGIRRSAGAGVRWYSPVGPLRVEYGFNLDRQGDEPSGRWEFSIGGML